MNYLLDQNPYTAVNNDLTFYPVDMKTGKKVSDKGIRLQFSGSWVGGSVAIKAHAKKLWEDAYGKLPEGVVMIDEVSK